MINTLGRFIKKYTTKNPLKLVILFILVYSLAAVLVSLNRHWQYETFYFDLGIFDQAIWRVSRLKMPMIDETLVMRNGSFAKNFFGDHFTPSVYLLSVLYWFTSKVEVLLVAQSLIVGASLWVAYLIAKKELKNGLVIFSLVFAYGGYVGLQNALITDFHAVTISIFAMMMMFWSIVNEKWKSYWLWLVLFLGFKESLGGMVIGIGIYLWFRNRKTRKIGVITALTGLIYSLVATQVIIPFFAKGSYPYSPVIPSSIMDLLSKLVVPFVKVRVMLVSMATFSFLPLLYPPLWPVFIEEFLQRFVFNLAGTRFDIGMHYNAVLTPILFMAAVEVIKKIERNQKIRKYVGLIGFSIIGSVIFIHRFWLHGPLGLAYNPEFYRNTKRQVFLDEFIAKIPTDRGSIMTQNHIASRFTHQQVYLIKKIDKYKQYDPKVVAIEMRDGQNPNNFFPSTRSEAEGLIKELKVSEDYEIIYQDDDKYIFQKIDSLLE